MLANSTTFVPAFSCERSPGSSLTMGTSVGTTMFFSPPLYLTVIVRPLLTSTLPTVPLVIELLLPRSHGRWPSPVPAMLGGNTWTSSALRLPSACGTAAVPI
ncbi:hypothetical protein D3C72_741350 [compost metagenome]